MELIGVRSSWLAPARKRVRDAFAERSVSLCWSSSSYSTWMPRPDSTRSRLSLRSVRAARSSSRCWRSVSRCSRLSSDIVSDILPSRSA